MRQKKSTKSWTAKKKAASSKKPTLAPKEQTPRWVTHAKVQAAIKKTRQSSKQNDRSEAQSAKASRKFNYDLDYKKLNLRRQPELYRVGVGEQGVLLVEPYKSEILPHWKFKTPADAKKSAAAIWKLFKAYRDAGDFVGMDMARKFLQMGFTRSRRYANHKSGRKYDKNQNLLPDENDSEKAVSAEIFMKAWKRAEGDSRYKIAKLEWKERLG